MKPLKRFTLIVLAATTFALTMPGKGWFLLLRLYSPKELFFDKTWRPSEIELVK